MKTTISISDIVFHEAEETAMRLGISRSELYTRAVKEFIETQRKQNVTAKLDEVYEREDSSLDAMLEKMQSITLSEKEW